MQINRTGTLCILKRVNNAFLYKTQLTLFSVPPMLSPLRSTLDSPTFNCSEDYYHSKIKKQNPYQNKEGSGYWNYDLNEYTKLEMTPSPPSNPHTHTHTNMLLFSLLLTYSEAVRTMIALSEHHKILSPCCLNQIHMWTNYIYSACFKCQGEGDLHGSANVTVSTGLKSIFISE